MGISKIWRYLIGDAEDLTFESQIFHTICIFSSIIVFEIVLQNLWLNLNQLALIWSIGLVVLVGLYWLSRFRRKFTAAWISFAVMSYIIQAYNFWGNQGIDGPSLITAFASLIILYAITPVRMQWLWVLLHIFIFGGLLVLESYNFLQIPVTYQGSSERYLDVGVSFVVTIIFSSIVLRYIRQRIEAQRRMAEEQQKQLSKQSEALSLSNHNLNKLFSVISHDVRTPLANIQGFLELQDLDENLDAVTRKKLNADLLALTKNTRGLLDNLLLWSKGQLQGHRYEPNFIQLNELLMPTIKLIEEQAKSKQVQLIYDFQGHEPIWCDASLIEISVRNLLSNALKFSKEGGRIWLEAILLEKECIISITDEGLGMDAQTQANLFGGDGFSTPGTHQEQGVGLGLQLCREFTKLHKGSLEFESEVGKGSRFWIYLPLAENAPQPKKLPQKSQN